MSKIEFGTNNDEKLNASWSNIQFYNGEYLDTINCNDMDFLITRIVDSSKELEGGIDVREVAQDFFSDGSYFTYANLEKNSLCLQIEKFLNTSKMKEMLEKERPLDVLRDAGFPAYTSHLLQIESKNEDFAELVTSVRPENFESLKKSKRTLMGMSTYYMTQEIMRLRQELEQLKANNNERHR